MKIKKLTIVFFAVCILAALVGCAAPKCANNSYNNCLNDADPECAEGLCDECCNFYKEDEYIAAFGIYDCDVDH